MESVENPPFDWLTACESLKSHLGSEVVGRWLDPLRVASVSPGIVILEAPNTFFRDWVLAHYLDRIKPLVGGREVQIITSPAPDAEERAAAVAAPEALRKAAPPARRRGSRTSTRG